MTLGVNWKKHCRNHPTSVMPLQWTNDLNRQMTTLPKGPKLVMICLVTFVWKSLAIALLINPSEIEDLEALANGSMEARKSSSETEAASYGTHKSATT